MEIKVKGFIISKDILNKKFSPCNVMNCGGNCCREGACLTHPLVKRINKHLHHLMRIAEAHNIAIYITNQVMARPDVLFGDPTQAIGGHIVGHASTYRIYLRRGRKDSRVAKMIDSPNLPESECIFFITADGLDDEI